MNPKKKAKWWQPRSKEARMEGSSTVLTVFGHPGHLLSGAPRARWWQPRSEEECIVGDPPIHCSDADEVKTVDINSDFLAAHEFVGYDENGLPMYRKYKTWP